MVKIQALEKIKTHILCSVTFSSSSFFFFFKIRAVYETMRKKFELDRPQMAI